MYHILSIEERNLSSMYKELLFLIGRVKNHHSICVKFNFFCDLLIRDHLKQEENCVGWFENQCRVLFQFKNEAHY